jgi:hypothetical protein
MDLKNCHYDRDLEMFTDPPREPDLDRLRFLRWLMEHRHMEHAPMGVPSGDYAPWAIPPEDLSRQWAADRRR